jgi:hypothetical protein
MAEPNDPGLLDVVPWSYGFAHSWALKWLIEHETTRDRVLSLLMPERVGPWSLTRQIVREQRVGTARADLAAWGEDRVGNPFSLAVEVKVADLLKSAQIKAYEDDGFTVALYAPGLTGFLFEPNGPVSQEHWVTGDDLAAAMDGASLPPIISTYIDAVRTEASRMQTARAFARGEIDDFPHDGQTPYDDVMDAAWVVEIVAALKELGAEDLRVRSEANDRGLFWAGSWYDFPGGGDAGLFVEVIADIRTHVCAITVKTAGGHADGRARAYQAAVDAGPPSEGPWRRGRRPSRQSGRVWTLDASEIDARETAQHAFAAWRFIARVAQS